MCQPWLAASRLAARAPVLISFIDISRIASARPDHKPNDVSDSLKHILPKTQHIESLGKPRLQYLLGSSYWDRNFCQNFRRSILASCSRRGNGLVRLSPPMV